MRCARSLRESLVDVGNLWPIALFYFDTAETSFTDFMNFALPSQHAAISANPCKFKPFQNRHRLRLRGLSIGRFIVGVFIFLVQMCVFIVIKTSQVFKKERTANRMVYAHLLPS